MSPILGIYASQISGHLYSNSYNSIATVTIGSSQSTISFTSIPSTYTHLQIRYIGKRNSAVVYAGGNMQFNSDTGSNYSQHELYGDGSSAYTSNAVSTTAIATYYLTGTTPNAADFSAGVIDILDYANTNKYKTARLLSGVDNNGAGIIDFSSGLWMNTAAINTITLFVGSNFVNGTQFALYGVN